MDTTPFVNEIMAQPAALRKVVKYYTGINGAMIIKKAADALVSANRVIVTGMGTSLYAPYILDIEQAGMTAPILIRDAGELLHFGLQGVYMSDVVVAVSQSGESAETRAVVERLKGRAKVVSIVNNVSSFMGKNSDIVLPLFAGKEASISTKTYTNTLAVIYLLSTLLIGKELECEAARLIVTADFMRQTMETVREDARNAAEYFKGAANLHVIARGSDLVTARQLALIVKEGAGVFSEALSGGLFRHGPVELAGEDHASLFIVSEGNEPELTMNLAEETARYGSRVLVLSDSGKRRCFGASNIAIEPPSGRLFPIACAPFIELFVHETAKLKGREAGVFRHAVKVTSRE